MKSSFSVVNSSERPQVSISILNIWVYVENHVCIPNSANTMYYHAETLKGSQGLRVVENHCGECI